MQLVSLYGLTPASRDIRNVEFEDETTIPRLDAALSQIRRNLLRGKISKCAEFGLLMAGEITKPYRQNPEFISIVYKLGDEVSPTDRSIGLVATKFSDLSFVPFGHVVVPAHTEEKPMYLHKTGPGSVVFSDLEEAMDYYNHDVAHELNKLEITERKSGLAVAQYSAVVNDGISS